MSRTTVADMCSMTTDSYVYHPCDADHIFIVNPMSFRRKQDVDAVIAGIESALNKYGDINYHIHISNYPRDAIGAVNRFFTAAHAKRPLRAYAVGDDGNLFDCLNALMGLERVELAVIPFGLENGFVRSFGEKASAAFRDVKAQLTSPSIPTDVICCDGHYAINYCSVGLESISVLWRANILKRFPKFGSKSKGATKCVYMNSHILSAISDGYSVRNYTIKTDGEQIDGQYSTIRLSNCPCCGRFMTPSGESLPDDGLLELVAGYAKSLPDAMRLLPLLYYGRHSKHRNSDNISFYHMLVKEVEISSDMPLIISLDGEMFYNSSIKIKLLPGGIRVVAPNGFEYRRRVPNNRAGAGKN